MSALPQIHEESHLCSIHGDDPGPVNCHLEIESIMNTVLIYSNMA